MKIRLLLLYLIFALKTNAQGTWTQKLSFPGPVRESAIGFSIGNYGYVGLGYSDAVSNFIYDFARYDPSANTWSVMTSFPGAARWGASAFATGNKGYVLCGFSNYTFYSDMWMFDPSNNSWTQKANFPGGARWHGVAFSIGNKGYYGLGFNTGSGGIYYSDLWEYDPSLNSWTQKANLPSGIRLFANAFTIGNKAYVVAGRDTSYSGNCNGNFWEFDPVANSWTQKSPYPGTPCTSLVSFTIGGCGYAGVGKVGVNGTVTPDFYKYDPSQNTWSPITFLPNGQERWLSVGLSIGNKGYISTGNLGCPPSCDLNDLWEYSLSSVGLNEGENSNDILVSPNPANEQFAIATNSPTKKIMRIADFNGKLIFEQEINNTAVIKTNTFQAGIYFMTLNSETKTIVRKLVVVH